MAPATVAVAAYALARSGCAHLVEPALWRAVAAQAAASMPGLGLSQAANLATALAEAIQAAPELRGAREVDAFFGALRERAERLLEAAEPGVRRPGLAGGLEAQAMVKVAVALGRCQRTEAGAVALQLARRCVFAGAALGAGHFRSVAQALVQLRVFDEDLLQALTAAQKPKPKRDAPSSPRR